MSPLPRRIQKIKKTYRGSGPARHQGCELTMDPGDPQMQQHHETSTQTIHACPLKRMFTEVVQWGYRLILMIIFCMNNIMKIYYITSLTEAHSNIKMVFNFKLFPDSRVICEFNLIVTNLYWKSHETFTIQYQGGLATRPTFNFHRNLVERVQPGRTLDLKMKQCFSLGSILN